VLDVPDVPEAMHGMLLCTLEVLEGVLCLLEYVGGAGDDGGDALVCYSLCSRLWRVCSVCWRMSDVLDVPDVSDVMHGMLLCTLEVMGCVLCLPEYVESSGDDGGDELCATLYTRGCGGCALFAGGAGGNGAAGGTGDDAIVCYSVCWKVWWVRSVCWRMLEVLQVTELMHLCATLYAGLWRV